MPGQGPWFAGGPRLTYEIPPVNGSVTRTADSSVRGTREARGEGEQDATTSAELGAGAEVHGAGAGVAAPSGGCRKNAPPPGAEQRGLVSDARQAPPHEPKRCRGCTAPVFWAQVLDGDDQRVFVRDRQTGQRVKAIPVDSEPTAVGDVVLYHRAGEGIVCRMLRRGEAPPAGGKLRTFHRCSNRAGRDTGGVQLLDPAAQISLCWGRAGVEAQGGSRGGGR